MKIVLMIIIPLFLSGCLYVNDRGISNNYYNDCHEYYDGMGIYHKKCDKNLIEYKDVKKKIETTYDEIAQ
ncbi:hypothetical protein [Sulfurospirillum sp. 1612]|uniref:hypothetical protein n=1 Tax=Sulfurospirillum sp. 1612 TaxID=3094835 RepID=UPI003FCEB828